MSALAIDLTDAAVTGAILAAGTAPRCCDSRPSLPMHRWPSTTISRTAVLLLILTIAADSCPGKSQCIP